MAFKKLYVGMWYLNTKLIANLDLVTKTVNMAAKLGATYRFMQGLDRTPGESLYIFIAPEYYFQFKSNQRFYDESIRDAFLKYFGPFGTSCPEMLFAPGTITWKKIKPEFDLRPYANAGRGARRQVEQRRAQATKTHDGYNTAFVFYGAVGPQPYYTYHKATDVGECLAADGDTTYKTEASRGVFGVGNLDFGIEICGDSPHATLGNLLNGYLVDIHLLLSQGMDHNFATQALNRIPVKDNGYFVHCDGTEDFDAANGVWRLARGTGTHGTNAAIKVVTPTALEEDTMDRIRARGFQIADTKTRAEGNTTFYYTDKLGQLPSPFLTQGNVLKIDPVNGAPADVKVWELDV